MASSKEFVQFACDQAAAFGQTRSQLMFGDYMIYLNERPIILICDDVPFVKKLPQLAPYLDGAPCGIPYPGAHERWILDIENRELLDALRARIAQRPDEMLALLADLSEDYQLYVDQRVRLAIPEGLPEALIPIYRARSLYLFRRIEDFDLIKSPELVQVLAAGYRHLAPLYHYIMSFCPETGL